MLKREPKSEPFRVKTRRVSEFLDSMPVPQFRIMLKGSGRRRAAEFLQSMPASKDTAITAVGTSAGRQTLLAANRPTVFNHA
jgi:hypothetical protein